MEYEVTRNTNSDALYHYGVKGQKWGVRRYQNKDGSLTPSGKKRYDSMSDDKLQKTLYRQVKKARKEQYGSGNQWNVSRTIGKNSKAVEDKYSKDRSAWQNSESTKQAYNKMKKLDKRAEEGKIDLDEYDRQYESIQKSIYRPDLDRSVIFGKNGREYSKEYLNKYGKDLNLAYLKDLGYDEQTSKEFADRILKANKKLLNGL